MTARPQERNATPELGIASFAVETWVTIVVLAAAIAFSIGAAMIGGRAGRFPLAVGCVTAVLVLFELAREYLGISRDSFQRRAQIAAGNIARAGPKAAVTVAAWFIGTVVMVYLIGVIPASFPSAAAYCLWIEGRSPRSSLLRGVIFSLALSIVFELAAGFSLYEGMFR